MSQDNCSFVCSWRPCWASLSRHLLWWAQLRPSLWRQHWQHSGHCHRYSWHVCLPSPLPGNCLSCMATVTTYVCSGHCHGCSWHVLYGYNDNICTVVGVATDFSDIFACQALCQVTACLFDGNNENIVGIATLHSSPVCLPGNCWSLMATMTI